MKVRQLETDLYNYIQTGKVVTFAEIANEFGRGNSGTYANFVPHAMSSIGLSNELADALLALRYDCSIFEIACGKRFHDFLVSVDISDDVEIVKVTMDDLKGNHITPVPDKFYWLPCAFCSDDGVKELLKTVRMASGNECTPLFTRVMTNMTENLNSRDPDTRLNVMAMISNTLSDTASSMWDKTIAWLEYVDAAMENYKKVKPVEKSPFTSLRGSTLRI